VQSNFVYVEAFAVIRVEVYSCFYQVDHIAALYMLPWKSGCFAEGTQEGIWGGTICYHVADMGNYGADGAAWVSMCECMVGKCFALFAIFLIINGEGYEGYKVSIGTELLWLEFSVSGKEFCVTQMELLYAALALAMVGVLAYS